MDNKAEALCTYVTPLADEALAGMDKLFDSIYASSARPSIPPEELLKAQLLMILYSIRSNRQLVEQIHYNFLFRWFLGMALDEKIYDHSTFPRIVNASWLRRGLRISRVLDQAKRKRLLSQDHFTFDGTLTITWRRREGRGKEGKSCRGRPGGLVGKGVAWVVCVSVHYWSTIFWIDFLWCCKFSFNGVKHRLDPRAAECPS